MDISETALIEFEKIWRKNNPSKDISKEELLDMATAVLTAVKLVLD